MRRDSLMVKDAAKGGGPRTTKKIREQQRVDIEVDLQKFLGNGGEIEQLPSCQQRCSNIARATYSRR